MALDKKFIDQFVNVTVKAASAASLLVGKKDKNAADQAAVDSMRDELNKIDMVGEVVIGEGSLDEAPMLYTGEILGNKKGPTLDIAVDPVEGTNFVANNLPGGITVLAIAKTAIPPCRLFATKFVPSTGSMAMSKAGPFLFPSISPVYNIGASSSEPSPITTLPIISILFSSVLIESTAA